MVVLVTGDRWWTDARPILRELRKLPRDTCIVHGGARGADTIADSLARALGMPTRSYPADWSVFRKRAGPIRNQEMLDKEHPSLVLAFHEYIESSSGTADMIARAKAADIEVRLFSK